MEPTTPAAIPAKGQPVLAHAWAEDRPIYVATETPMGIEFVNVVVFCQCCGVRVTGPQVRDHHVGDVLRLIGPHTATAGGVSVIVREGRAAMLDAINDDGSYLITVPVPVFSGGEPLTAQLTVWPGETEEEAVWRGEETKPAPAASA